MQILSKISIFLLFLLMCLSVQAQGQEPLPVSFATEDGGIIHADLFQSGKYGVILAHGAIFNKKSWRQLAKILANQGFSVLAIDFRGYGKSTPGGNPDALYEDILEQSAILGSNRKVLLSLIGASMGGGTAAKAAIVAAKGEIDKLIYIIHISTFNSLSFMPNV